MNKATPSVWTYSNTTFAELNDTYVLIPLIITDTAETHIEKQLDPDSSTKP
jgi:hypothetical protein